MLVRSFLLARQYRGDGVIDAIVTDGTIGLYLGWVTIATVANITAAWSRSASTASGSPRRVGRRVIAVAGLSA